MESSPVIADTLRIHPSGPLRGTLVPPSSKYHTLRYTLAACLAAGESIIHAPAISDDTRGIAAACTQLGAEIRAAQSLDAHPPDAHEGHSYIWVSPTSSANDVDEGAIGAGIGASGNVGMPLVGIRGWGGGGGADLLVRGTGGVLRMPAQATIDVGNAGAVLRLLMGICATLPEPVTFVTPYPESLGRRPNADLLEALAQLGVSVVSQDAGGTLPITLYGGSRRGVRGGKVQVSGKKSSQYISALLFLAPLLPEGLDIEIVDGLASASFVDLTIEILREAGISITEELRHRRYVIPGTQPYRPGEYHIPGDYPSAAALLAAAAVTRGEITLANLLPGDAGGEAVLNAFAEMGVQITRTGTGIHARCEGPLHGITFDGNTAIDSIPVISAATCFAETPSYIYNIAHLRLKESDRINDLAAELNKASCQVISCADAIEIRPAGQDGIAGGVTLDAHADHRLIEACAIVGLGSRQPVTINGALHIAKSYPAFFEDLRELGAIITIPG